MAQLMLHREVLKGFGKLPGKVQKKVVELTKKFEADSTQASIHLEPLPGLTKDRKVRSARVGDDYRAIVIAPEVGDVFLLMYIDHHDEAYEWCKNKRFEAHAATGTLQVFDVEEVSEAAEQITAQIQPEQTYILDGLTDEELFQAGVPEALIPAVRAAKSDEAFSQLSDYLPKEASQVLIGVIDGMTLDQAIEEMLGGLDASAKPESAGDFSHLANAANMDLVLVEGEEHLNEILSQGIEEWRIFLHPYQRKLVELKTNGPMKINGAAGTGKTVALMHRAAHLASQLEDPKDKVLITTYTTNLSVTIKSLMDKLAPDVASHIEVTNLHQLARTICQRVKWAGRVAEDADIAAIWEKIFESNKQIEFEREFVETEFRDIVDPMGIDSEEAYLTAIRTGRPRVSRGQRKKLWRLFVTFNQELSKRNLLTFEGVIHQARLAVEQGKFSRYRHVLVDELQDFGLEALKLIAALSPIEEELSDPLCVVGDGHQRIYRRTPIALSRAGINVRGARSKRLKINYRTTEEIREWAQRLLDGEDVDDLDGGKAVTVADHSIMKGPVPEVVKVNSLDEAKQALVAWIKGLQSAGLHTHEICFTPTNSEMVKALESAGIPTLELRARQVDPGANESGVRYGTKHRIKGLEFRAVALICNGPADDASERYANYVAVTRAREKLLVISIS
ncbi:MAG: UvrD-helicase domain-containing protein [Pseudomonadota bacterium]|nr:UvrD-helicase domain-containing protein [Pseudomonadota bacterium]